MKIFGENVSPHDKIKIEEKVSLVEIFRHSLMGESVNCLAEPSSGVVKRVCARIALYLFVGNNGLDSGRAQ